MRVPKNIILSLLSSTVIALFSSCNKEFKNDNYTAYFGGEVINPTNPYVLFCKEGKVIDTIPLDKNNAFFIKFDSLTPGMYTFKHEPEYQYVYFDKNDSIMVHINSKVFDESIFFSGRGDQKNNFIMDMYLKNEADKNKMFSVFDYDFDQFTSTIDSTYKKNKLFYNSKKLEIKWSDDFDLFAKAIIDFNYYSKKELYPIIHKIRTGNDNFDKLPKYFYDYRKNVNFSTSELSTFLPYVNYLVNLLNNVSEIKYHNHFSEFDKELKTNINKLNIADTLIKNKELKNKILNNIAFNYLLVDQNMVNNQAFLDTYSKYSTDSESKNEILKIGKSIQLLKSGNTLPKVNLVTKNGAIISSNTILHKKSVIFFYTKNAESHMIMAHKKALEFQTKHPNYQFIAVNLDDNQENWTKLLTDYNLNGIQEYRTENFNVLKDQWAITKIYRTMVLDENGILTNAFTNIFEANFEDQLK